MGQQWSEPDLGQPEIVLCWLLGNSDEASLTETTVEVSDQRVENEYLLMGHDKTMRFRGGGDALFKAMNKRLFYTKSVGEQERREAQGKTKTRT